MYAASDSRLHIQLYVAMLYFMFERCLYFNVNALSRTVNRIWNEAFAELDLSPAHGYLLRLVLDQAGLSPKDIARELRLDKSTVTRFVDALQDKGLVQRQKAASGDQREQRIFPTNKAEKLKRPLNALGDQLYQHMLNAVGKQQLTSLVRQLRETAAKLD